MILVDSAVWIDFFQGITSKEESRLKRGLEAQEELTICPVVLTEVLQGFRLDRSFVTARRFLERLRILEMDIEGYVAAAHLFRDMRRKGVTVRGTIDCIVAQTCIEFGAELLARDRDYVPIAKHSSLDLCVLA